MKLSFETNKSPNVVWYYLTDMQQFADVHPVITRIEEKGKDCFLVYETLKLAGMPFSFTYPAIIETRPQENKIIMTAIVMKLTKVKMTFVIKTINKLTIIEEALEIKSPLPVQSIVYHIFKKQHTQLFKNIEMR